MLADPAADAEGLRRVRVLRAAVFVPHLGFQGVNQVFAGHQVDETTAEIVGDVLVFHLRIEGAHPHPGLPEVGQQELQQVGFALPAVAEDQDAGVGLIVGTAVEIHQHVAAVFVPSDVEAVGVGLAAVLR